MFHCDFLMYAYRLVNNQQHFSKNVFRFSLKFSFHFVLLEVFFSCCCHKRTMFTINCCEHAVLHHHLQNIFWMCGEITVNYLSSSLQNNVLMLITCFDMSSNFTVVKMEKLLKQSCSLNNYFIYGIGQPVCLVTGYNIYPSIEDVRWF